MKTTEQKIKKLNKKIENGIPVKTLLFFNNNTGKTEITIAILFFCYFIALFYISLSISFYFPFILVILPFVFYYDFFTCYDKVGRLEYLQLLKKIENVNDTKMVVVKTYERQGFLINYQKDCVEKILEINKTT